MFLSGIDARLATPFSVTTMLISVPFAIILLAMLATLWRGSLSFPTPMQWALGFVPTFAVGGPTGILVGSAAVDIYYFTTPASSSPSATSPGSRRRVRGLRRDHLLVPEDVRRLQNEGLGRRHFGLTLLAFNAVFLPMFVLRLGGHMRRI